MSEFIDFVLFLKSYLWDFFKYVGDFILLTFDTKRYDTIQRTLAFILVYLPITTMMLSATNANIKTRFFLLAVPVFAMLLLCETGFSNGIFIIFFCGLTIPLLFEILIRTFPFNAIFISETKQISLSELPLFIIVSDIMVQLLERFSYDRRRF